jgi:MFS family permease
MKTTPSTEPQAPAHVHAVSGAWTPLQTALFRNLWIATTELVPTDEMPSAIALNSVAINGARAIGPAIAGVLVAAVGAWLVFLLNALSYIGILAVLMRWRREHHKSTLKGNPLANAFMPSSDSWPRDESPRISRGPGGTSPGNRHNRSNRQPRRAVRHASAQWCRPPFRRPD